MNTTVQYILKLTRFSKPWKAEGNCCIVLDVTPSSSVEMHFVRALLFAAPGLPGVTAVTVATFA
jgi:hypothetical protein